MLTPEQLQAARDKFGITPAPSTTPTVDKVGSMSDTWAAADAKKNDTYLGRVKSTMSEAATGVGQHFMDSANSTIQDFETLKTRNAGEKNPAIKVLNALVFAGHTAGNIAKSGAGIIEGTIKTGLAPVSQIKTPETAMGANEAIRATSGGRAGGDTLGHAFTAPVQAAAQKLVTSLAEKHPDVVNYIAKQVEAHPDIARGISDVVYTYSLKSIADNSILGKDIPNISEVAKSMKNEVQNLVDTTTGVVKNTVKAVKGIGTPKDVVATIDTIDRHLASSQQILDSGVPNSPELVGRLKTNIVDGLKGEGKDKVAAQIAKLNTADFETPDDFATAAKNLINPPKDLQKAIDAVNPDLTGKKLAGAYEDVVKGTRTAKSRGLFTEQKLSPGQQAINVATRLNKDIPINGESTLPKVTLVNKPVKDLGTLADSIQATEKHIDTLLDGDPSLVYNADKPTLMDALNVIKDKSPREFGSIKDSKAVYDDVIKFAQETIDKADDTVRGIREARTAFDSAAKEQFPSAFKEGFIDTKTPAGIAIRAARDTINEHLYNTAPEGSVIKQLILREADIFRAAQNIAAKAGKTHGTTMVGAALDTLREHPYWTALGLGAAGYGVVKTVLP